MTILEYLIKFSICLAGLYVFYRVVLRPLTFYQWNRFFLLGYSLLAFGLPFVNIGPWIAGQGMTDNSLVNRIPPMELNALQANNLAIRFPVSEWLMILFCSGIIFMLIRMAIQYRSLLGIHRKSVLLDAEGNIRVYETTAAISPFSFGNAIYLNRRLHSEDELQRILQHEIVHVKQQHTIDLLIGELLCLVNWYNPFAWLIRNAIRQNLEFIADNNVLAKGHDKKEYQYLLLKVVGVPQFSIANNFNLPHLKKRIAMMNKMKSAGVHLTKFLFVLPFLLLFLLAFRSGQNKHTEVQRKMEVNGMKVNSIPVADTIPPATSLAKAMPPAPAADAKPNGKGYILSVADNNGECVILIKDKKRKIIKALTLEEWNSNKSENENRYGKIPVGPKPPVPPVPPVPAAPVPAPPPTGFEPVAPVPPAPPAPSAARMQPAVRIKDVIMQADTIIIRRDSGDIVVYQKPVYMVDGVEETDEMIAHAIEPSEIKSVSVFKGADATARYGEKGKNGVVEIKTKPELYIVNGVEQPVSVKVLANIKTEDIESVNVLKGNSAKEKYGEKGKNGVIEIKTKKP